jgi:inner membrane protein
VFTLFLLVFWLFVIIGLAVAGLTALWLCFRATTPEGEPAPKWGDLRPLRRLPDRILLILRMLAVAVLAGFMVIPANFVHELTQERYVRYGGVIEGISSLWGTPQTLIGPVMSVPYTVRYDESESVPLTAAELAMEQARGSDRTAKEVVRTVESDRAALILPETLRTDGKVATELRSRGIYSARVYTADMTVSGLFTKPDLTGLRPNIVKIHWDRAEIAVGLSSTKAIRDISELNFAGEKRAFLPGTGGIKILPTGFSSRCDLSAFQEGKPIEFSFRVSMGGSGSLFLTPVGAVNEFTLASEWPHPNFAGSGLPSSREITPQGFSAEWKLPNLVRNYPQLDDLEAWDTVVPPDRFTEHRGYNLSEYVAGVEFFEPVFHYSLLIRSTKYAVLFIALTFLGVVVFEHHARGKRGAKLSMIQYGVIGLGLSLFYLTLLALSEHIGFTGAYLSAAAINVAMTAGYVSSALKNRRPAVLTAGMQGLLYVMLFFILRMKDYALLTGSFILLAAMAALMTVTRNMNQPENSPADIS